MRAKSNTTPMPATLVVFGSPNGAGEPRAGLFPAGDRGPAALAANLAGLSAVTMSADQLAPFADELDRGRILKGHRLRLRSVSPKLLIRLRALSRKQAAAAAEPEATSEHQSEIRPSHPADGDPPGGAEPPGGAVALGPDLVPACQLLDRAGRWIERLKTGLDEILVHAAGTGGLTFLKAEEPAIEPYDGGDGWVLDGWRWSYPARRGRQRIGRLSIAFDLGRPGRPAEALRQPLVLVLWSGPEHDLAVALDAATGFWPPAATTTRLSGQRLFQWVGEASGTTPGEALPAAQGAWFFIVPLQALDSVTKLKGLIVQAALDLLAGSTVEAAFAATHEVLRFRRAHDRVSLIKG